MSRSGPVDVRVPGDKSMTHRALVLAAVAEGVSRLDGLLDAADTRATRVALQALGADLEAHGPGAMTVRGVGLDGLRTPAATIDCGNSGTTARLLLGLLGGCGGVAAVLTGDASLCRRPMRRVTSPLARSGARYEELGEDGRLPIRVRGTRPLGPIVLDDDGGSAQVKTAMLLAGLTGAAEVRVTEGGASRDHTERMLRAMGVDLRIDDRAGRPTVGMDPPPRLEPLDFEVPGDISSAAFFLGLAALRGGVRVRGVGLNPTRTGALAVLERMGAVVDVETGEDRGGEPVGDVTVRAGPLAGTAVSVAEVPTLLDEIPLLAAVAARAEGETRFDGVAELRVKESDRIAAMEANLLALGVEARSGPDHLVVTGGAGPLKGRVRSFGDHRIAMAFGVLAALPDSEIEIEDRNAVGISYPGFWSELERVRTKLEAE